MSRSPASIGDTELVCCTQHHAAPHSLAPRIASISLKSSRATIRVKITGGFSAPSCCCIAAISCSFVGYTGPAGNCSCDTGYSGSVSYSGGQPMGCTGALAGAGCASVTCGANGSCSSGFCICDGNYTGCNCEIAVPPSGPSPRPTLVPPLSRPLSRSHPANCWPCHLLTAVFHARYLSYPQFRWCLY